jgi:predicted glycosyltransferase
MRARGWDVAVTARAFAQTLALLELHGIEHTVIGRHGGGSRPGKARAAAERVGSMIRFGRRGRFDVALAHGSTDLPMACRVLRVPSTPPCSTASTAGWRTGC